MSNIEYGEYTRDAFHSTVGDIATEILANGGNVSTIAGAVEFYERDITEQMDDEALDSLYDRVANHALYSVVMTGDRSEVQDSVFEEALELHKSLPVRLSYAWHAISYGDSLRGSRSRRVRDHAQPFYDEAFVAMPLVWESLEFDSPEAEMSKFDEEYERAYPRLRSSDDVHPAAKQYYLQTLLRIHRENATSEDAATRDQANHLLHGSLSAFDGGTENPDAQRLLRNTPPSHEDCFRGLSTEALGDRMLLSGQIEHAFELYEIAHKYFFNEQEGPERQRDTLPALGNPWEILRGLLDENGEGDVAYTDRVLDFIEEKYPATFTFNAMFTSRDIREVLALAGRAPLLAQFISVNAKQQEDPESLTNLTLDSAYKTGAFLREQGLEETYQATLEELLNTPEYAFVAEGLTAAYEDELVESSADWMNIFFD